MFYVRSLVFGFVADTTRHRDGRLKIRYTQETKTAKVYMTMTGARKIARLLGYGHVVITHEEALYEEKMHHAKTD